MSFWQRVKFSWNLLWHGAKAVLVFKQDPTEGDTITVGRMKAEFKPRDFWQEAQDAERARGILMNMALDNMMYRQFGMPSIIAPAITKMKFVKQIPLDAIVRRRKEIKMKFRKKPVVVEAYQWFKVAPFEEDVIRDVDYFRHPEIPGTKVCEHCGKTMHEHGYMDTLEGGHTVCPGDWIITGVKGEKYPCKPDIFAATYEPADQEDLDKKMCIDPEHCYDVRGECRGRCQLNAKEEEVA